MRLPDWPERLAAYIQDRRERPFRWGSNDCCSFARGAVLAIGGPDLGIGWAGEYADEDGARAAIQGMGRDLEAAVESACRDAGLVETESRLAQRGDLLVVRERRLIGGMPLAAVCTGRDALAVGLRGVLALPMRAVVRAWAVS